MRMNSITHRRLSLAIVLLSWGSVGVALFTQHRLGMEPCPWCIAQRLLYLLCGAMALLAAWPSSRSYAGRLVASLFLALTALSALATVVTALYQHLVAAATGSCAITAVDRFLMYTGLSDWQPEIFEPRASCAEADQSLMNLPYSLWSAALAVLLLVLACLTIRMLWRSRSGQAVRGKMSD